MSLHLIMPMAGGGSRFSEQGFSWPKPLIPINGYPFFHWAAQSAARFMELKSIVFVVLKEHVERFGLDDAIRRFYPKARIEVLDQVLDGAVLTCLEGVKHIDDQAPVLFNDCDHIFTCREFYGFCAAGKFEGVDGALLTFTSSDPKFSFVELDGVGHVLRTVEKEAVSDQAICGAYYFRGREVFERAAGAYLPECPYKEYFVSGVYNVLARQGALIKCFKVDMHLPFGTPEEYAAALNSEAFGALS